jgi:hypothetical protein
MNGKLMFLTAGSDHFVPDAGLQVTGASIGLTLCLASAKKLLSRM